MKTVAPHFGICFLFAISGCAQEVDWFVNKPKNLLIETISNDVWHWYHADVLEPLAVQRVVWNSKSVPGSKRWGYFIYHQGRLTGPDKVRTIRQEAGRLDKYSGLPAWAKHIPDWWKPDFILPPETVADAITGDALAFGSVIGDEVIIYCLKRPLDSAILHEVK